MKILNTCDKFTDTTDITYEEEAIQFVLTKHFELEFLFTMNYLFSKIFYSTEIEFSTGSMFTFTSKIEF